MCMYAVLDCRKSSPNSGEGQKRSRCGVESVDDEKPKPAVLGHFWRILTLACPHTFCLFVFTRLHYPCDTNDGGNFQETTNTFRLLGMVVHDPVLCCISSTTEGNDKDREFASCCSQFYFVSCTTSGRERNGCNCC